MIFDRDSNFLFSFQHIYYERIPFLDLIIFPTTHTQSNPISLLPPIKIIRFQGIRYGMKGQSAKNCSRHRYHPTDTQYWLTPLTTECQIANKQSDSYNTILLKPQFKAQMTSSYLPKPILTKKSKVYDSRTFTATSCEMQGWRKSMEDSLVYKDLGEQVQLFAVCDGHGGPQVSNLVAKLLPDFLIKDADYKSKQYAKALTTTFRKLDEYIASEKGEKELQALNKSLDGKKISPDDKVGYRAGTTLLVLLLTKQKYIVANVGDSRAILSRNNQAVTLSNDHKPQDPSEKQRIQKAGGYVHNGRVNASLALSRSLGDFQFKHFSNRSYEQQAVISLPEIIQLPRTKQDNFILMACDGVWQKYVQSNQKMVDHVKNLRSRYNNKDIIENLMNDLVAKDCRELLGCDNMSGILIEFQ